MELTTRQKCWQICRHKANKLRLHPKTYEQNLETLELPRKYKVILVPSSTLQLVVDVEAVKQAMKRLYEHVLPTGILVASIMTLWQEDEPLYSE